MYYSNSTRISNTISVFLSQYFRFSSFCPPFVRARYLGLASVFGEKHSRIFSSIAIFFGGTKIFSLLLFSYFDCRRQKKITKSNNFQLSLQSPVIFLLKTYCSPYLYPPLLHHPAVHSFLSVSTFRRSFHGGFPLYGDDRYVLPPPTTSLLQTDHSIYYWSTVNNLADGCIIPSISNCWSGFMHYVPLESCYFYSPLGS